MAKKKKKGNILGLVLVALTVVGLILTIVGMFVGQVTATGTLLGQTETTTIKLFDEGWGVKEVLGKNVGVSNTFGVISFIVTLIGLAVLALDAIAHYILGKNLKLIRYIGVALSLVGAILILVAGLVMANQCAESFGVDLGAVAKSKYSAGIGVWLGFIGGLIGAAAGGVAILKK